MYQFAPWLESLFAQCTPFDESPIRQSAECTEIAQSLRAARRLLARHAPESMADIDAFLDTYMEMIDLECRHYFSEGYCLGRMTLLNSEAFPHPPLTSFPEEPD